MEHIRVMEFQRLATTRFQLIPQPHQHMPLPKLLRVTDTERMVVTPAPAPMETWINIDDISTIGISCTRTPIVEIRLRYEPQRRVIVKGADAKALIAKLRALKE
jgi:hypothetical protein